MGISLKKITEMVVAQTLQGDEHLFLQIGAAFQEVPLPILAAAITRTVGFPKSADDLSAEYAAALEEDADLTPKEFLLTLPAGNYILPVQVDEGEVETYQISAMQGSDGNITRVILTSGAASSIELYSTAYDEDDPLFAVDGESGDLLLKGNPVATRAEITQSLVGLGVPIVKESAASAELAGNSYHASGDNFPVVVPADQAPDHRPVGKGSQIVFIPEHNNTGTDPMLTLNDGVSVPIRQRAAIDTQTADNTVQIAKDTLIQGMPYTMTFCGVAWLIDSYLPGEGSETTAKVTSVNNQTGRVTITADGIGAAMKAYNWQSAKRGFDIYLENVEEITPEDYMWLLGQGLFYLRADDGQHFMIRSDMGAMVEAVEGGEPAHRDGPAVRAYLFIPLEDDEESTISGGVWIGATKILSIDSLEDLTSLTFLVNGSKVVTEAALLQRLTGYVTNAALLQALQGYAQKSYVSNAISNALSKFYNATIGESNYTDILGALQAGGIVYAYYDGEIFFAYESDPRGSALIEFASESRVIACGLGLPSGTKWFAPVQRNLETSNNKVTSLSSESTDTQYPSAKAVFDAISAIAGQSGWEDVSAEYAAYCTAHPETAQYDFVTKSRPFTKALADGRYVFKSSENDVVHAHIITAGSGANAVKYRLFLFSAHDTASKFSIEYYQDDTRILGTSSPDGVLRLTVLGKTVVYKDEFLSAMAGVPSRESVSAEMTQKINAVTQTYNALSVVRTRLQKFANMKHTIRVEIENARMLLDEEDVILQLWVCSRKHGTAHHWWHPGQPGSQTRSSPIGYGLIAGDAIYPNRPLENDKFPAVPAWMPNNGHMQTEIPVTHQDLINGYVEIDCSTYFLPMIKPRSTVWRYKDVGLMFTQRTKDVYKRYSVPVTWTVGVLRDGQYKTVGSYANIAKIGIPRGFNGTVVDGTSKKKTIKALHISIT